MTLKHYRARPITLGCVAALLLAGCGGGGSSSAPSSSNSSGSGSGSSTSYTVSGTVSGLATGESVTVTDDGTSALTVTADGSFTFSTPLASGAAYAVAVQSSSAGITCQASNASGTVGSADITNVAVNCTAAAPQTYTIGGAVSGLGAAQSVTLTDNGSNALVVATNGSFTFTTALAGGTTYRVAVQSSSAGLACQVTNGSGTVGSANITSVAVNCTATAPKTYTIGGTVSGLSAGQNVTLTENGGNALQVTANGPFSFSTALATGATYQVAVQPDPDGITCQTANASGVIGSSNVTNIAVLCGYKHQWLYSFRWGTDGAFPGSGRLVMDQSGNLYGTTEEGGAYSSTAGTVFKVSPTGTETILHSFGATAADGQLPYAGVVRDAAGNLYGTTESGGAYNHGTVYKLSPTGAETVLYSFNGTGSSKDGYAPVGGLTLDSAGDLYGTTSVGGAYGDGTVFKLTPTGTETVLYSFGTHSGDGTFPHAGIVMDASGNIYGTTENGGAFSGGTVFKLSQSGGETILHSFGATSTDGTQPIAGLTLDSAGNLYGTTIAGGAQGYGTVFKISPAGSETLLLSFKSGTGSTPLGRLIIDGAGNLYGTTNNSPSGNGTAFELEPSGNIVMLWRFQTSSPQGGLVMDSSGNLFGTIITGGQNNDGAVFELSP